MTDAVLPTPRRIGRTAITSTPSGFSTLGDALSVMGKATGEFAARQRATEEQVTETDHRIAMAEEKRQDDALYIQKAQELALLEAETREEIAALRQNAGAFAQGHQDEVRKVLEKRLRPFDESLLGNERVRQRFRLGLAESAARIDVQETAWQREQEFRGQGEALDSVVTTLTNELTRVEPAKADEQLAAAWARADGMIDAGAFNDDQAAVMRRVARTKLALGMTTGLLNAGQVDAVDQLVKGGFFDGLDLDAAKIGEQVAGERRALEIAAERQQAEAISAARAQADAVEAKVRLGINPDQQEVDAANAALAAAGVPEAERITFGGLSVEIGLNRQYSEASDPDGVAAARTVHALSGKIAAGTASETEQVAYRHLSGVADARAKAAGAKRKDLAAQGVQGQMAVLADLDRMPPEQRFIAANAARNGMGWVAGLPPHSRQYALQGREIRTARKDAFGTKDEVTRAFKAETGQIAASLGGSYDNLMDLAWDLYAGGVAAEGGEGWDAKRFAKSVDTAFGQTRRPDGSLQGGLGEFRGRKVILPEYQTANEFERSVRSLTFEGAVYADGSAVRAADVVSNYRPEYHADGPDGRPKYRMIDASGRPLLKKGGGVYDFSTPRRGAR